MPRNYEDPTPAYVRGATRRGPVNPAHLADPTWSPQEKNRFVNKFNALLESGEAATDPERDAAFRRVREARMMRNALPPFMREAAAGAVSGVRAAQGLGVRAIETVGQAAGAEWAQQHAGETSLTNTFTRRSNELDAASDLATRQDSGGGMETDLRRGITGASRSITQAAAGGGPWGSIASFAASQANQAAVQAEDAGLTGKDKYAYIGTSAAIEGLIAGVSQRFFGGGQEGLQFGGPATMKEFFKQTGIEVGEEVLTEAAHAYNDVVSGVREPLTDAEKKQLFKDTVFQTILATGAIHTANTYGPQAKEWRQQRQALREGLASSYGWDTDVARETIDRAVKRKGDFWENFGHAVEDTARTTGDGLAEWVREDPERARELAKSDRPSRTAWRNAKLPDRNDRARVVSEIRDLLEGYDQGVAERQQEPDLEAQVAQQAERAGIPADAPVDQTIYPRNVRGPVNEGPPETLTPEAVALAENLQRELGKGADARERALASMEQEAGAGSADLETMGNFRVKKATEQLAMIAEAEKAGPLNKVMQLDKKRWERVLESGKELLKRAEAGESTSAAYEEAIRQREAEKAAQPIPAFPGQPKAGERRTISQIQREEGVGFGEAAKRQDAAAAQEGEGPKWKSLKREPLSSAIRSGQVEPQDMADAGRRLYELEQEATKPKGKSWKNAPLDKLKGMVAKLEAGKGEGDAARDVRKNAIRRMVLLESGGDIDWRNAPDAKSLSQLLDAGFVHPSETSQAIDRLRKLGASEAARKQAREEAEQSPDGKGKATVDGQTATVQIPASQRKPKPPAEPEPKPSPVAEAAKKVAGEAKKAIKKVAKKTKKALLDSRPADVTLSQARAAVRFDTKEKVQAERKRERAEYARHVEAMKKHGNKPNGRRRLGHQGYLRALAWQESLLDAGAKEEFAGAPEPGERGYRPKSPDLWAGGALDWAIKNTESLSEALGEAERLGLADLDSEDAQDAREVAADLAGVPSKLADGTELDTWGRYSIAYDLWVLANVAKGDTSALTDRGDKVLREYFALGKDDDPSDAPRWVLKAALQDAFGGHGSGRRLRLVNVGKQRAAEFIKKHHSKLPDMNPRGLLYAIGVMDGYKLVAVATANTPTAPWKGQKGVLELTRVASDGSTKNASSMLAGRILDLLERSKRDPDVPSLFVTYQLASEKGSTYKALKDKGLRPVAFVKGKKKKGGSRKKAGDTALASEDKIRWEAGDRAGPADWSLLEQKPPAVSITDKQRETLAAAAKLETASTEEIAEALGISEGAARGRMRTLEKKGLVESEETEGTYASGSSALKHLDWHVDPDDDLVQAALGKAEPQGRFDVEKGRRGYTVTVDKGTPDEDHVIVGTRAEAEAEIQARSDQEAVAKPETEVAPKSYLPAELPDLDAMSAKELMDFTMSIGASLVEVAPEPGLIDLPGGGEKAIAPGARRYLTNYFRGAKALEGKTASELARHMSTDEILMHAKDMKLHFVSKVIRDATGKTKASELAKEVVKRFADTQENAASNQDRAPKPKPKPKPEPEASPEAGLLAHDQVEASTVAELDKEVGLFKKALAQREEEAQKLKREAERYGEFHKLFVTKGRNKGQLRKSPSKAERSRQIEYKARMREYMDAERLAQTTRESMAPAQEKLQRGKASLLVQDESASMASRTAARMSLYDVKETIPEDLFRAHLDATKELLSGWGDIQQHEVNALHQSVSQIIRGEAAHGNNMDLEAVKDHATRRPSADLGRLRVKEVHNYAIEKGVMSRGIAYTPHVDKNVQEKIKAMVDRTMSRDDVAAAKKLIDKESKAVQKRIKKAAEERAQEQLAAEEARSLEQQKFKDILEGDLSGKLGDLSAKIEEARGGDKTLAPMGIINPLPIKKSIPRAKDTMTALASHNARGPMRYAMFGTLVDKQPGKDDKVAVATDGKRLIVVPYDGDLPVGGVYRRPKKSEKNVLSQRHGEFVEVDGHFPPYRDVIPDLGKFKGSVKVTPELLDRLRGLYRASKVMGAHKVNPDHYVYVEIYHDYGKPSLVNAVYVYEAIHALTRAGHEVTAIHVKDDTSPVVFTTDNESALALVMPINAGNAGVTPGADRNAGPLRMEIVVDGAKVKPASAAPAKQVKGFRPDRGGKAVKGGMSVGAGMPPLGGTPAGQQQLFPAAGMTVGDMLSLLERAGADMPSIFPKLARGALGRFSPGRGIALDKNIWEGPIIENGLADTDDAAQVADDLVQAILAANPALDPNDLFVQIDPTKRAGTMRIIIRLRDPSFPGKVTAHEIGHLIDYLPDKVQTRGNILGRLATLRRFLKSTLKSSMTTGASKSEMNKLRRQARKETGDPPTKGTPEYDAWVEAVDARRDELAKAQGLILKSEVMDELKALTLWWNPFDPDEDRKYTNYRFGSDELYAEAMSVLLNQPDQFMARAPVTAKAWWDALDRKPEVKKAYDSVVSDIVTGTSGEAIRARVVSGFRKGESQAQALAAIRKRRLSPRTVIPTLFVDKASQLYRDTRDSRRKGLKGPDPRHAYDEAKYTGSVLEQYERDAFDIIDWLEKQGVGIESFGEYLQYTRVIEGEQGTKAAPTTGDLPGTEKAMSDLRRAMGPTRMAALESARKQFWEVRKRLVMPGLEHGPYSQDFANFLRTNEHYSRFQVVEYMKRRFGKEGASLALPARHGGLKDIRNPFIATVDFDARWLRSLRLNKAKQTAADFYLLNRPGEIKPADTVFDQNVKRHIPKPPTDNPNLGLLTFVRNGELEGYYVEKSLADAFNAPGLTLPPWIRGSAHIGRLFFTVLRPGFQVFNVGFRDPIRSTINLPTKLDPKKSAPGAVVGGAIGAAIGGPVGLAAGAAVGGAVTGSPIYRNLPGAIWESIKDEFGVEASQVVRELRERGDLVSFDRLVDPDTDLTWTDAFKDKHAGRHKLKSYKKRARSLNPIKWATIFYDGMLTLGQAFETAGKVAAYKWLKENQSRLGWSDEKIDHAIRHWASSPSFITGGTATPLTNNVLLFSNAQIQGWRSDIEAFSEDKAGVFKRRMAYSIMPKLFAFTLGTGLVEAMLRAMGADDEDESIKWAKHQQKILSRVKEYDLANYTVIPLGLDSNDKAVYLRIPQDETSRAIGGVLVKLLQGEDVTNSVQSALDYAGGQTPGWSPILTFTHDVWTYTTGGNPYDSFRERHAVRDDVRARGGYDSHAEFSKWLWNRYGGTMIYKFHNDNPAQIASEVEQVTHLPIVSDTLGRFLVVSDYGLVQKIKRAREKAESERVGQRMKIDAAVRRQIKGEPEPGDQQLLFENRSRAEHVERTLRARATGPMGSALTSANTAEETAAILRTFMEREPDAPGLQQELDDFIGTQLYNMTRGGKDGPSWRARTKKLLKGLPVGSRRDAMESLARHWIKRHKRIGPGFAPRMRRAIRMAEEAGLLQE